MKHIIAIDIGTQSARAAVITQDGTIVAIEQIKHEMESPRPNWAQQSPDRWWENICTALQTVLQKTAIDKKSIKAIATCGQMHAPVGLDEAGRVTTDSVQLWCDKRCEEQCRTLQSAGSEQELSALSANPVAPAWTGIKVRWLKDNDPAAYERSRWFLVPKDFINFRLTGVAAADPSEASGSYLYDCRTDDYSPLLAEKVGVDLSRFAPIYRSQDIIGCVTETAANQTGLPAGIPVVAGGGDFPVSMLGFGIVGEGVTADVTGTSTLLATHSPRPLINPAIQNLRHVVDGWIPFTILDCGGISQKWVKDLLSSMRDREVSYDELEALAESVAPGSEGLFFYPYMLGERRPENMTARGGWFGLALNHQAPHLARSVLEGVALSMGKDLGEFRACGHKLQRLLSVGGGTRCEPWNRIKAAIVQAPLELSSEPEAGLKGAAILGAAGAGLISDPVQTALERRAQARVVEPDPELVEAYKPVQKEFERIYNHMLGFWADQ